jgi:hypothetical protein
LEVNRGVTALTALIEARGLALQDVSIHRPTLDDAFLELTGAGSD